MSKWRKGDRIGAIWGSNGQVIELFGYGVYDGEQVPQAAMGLIGEILQEEKIPNHKLLLDSGQVIYGCECWWGPEEKIKQIVNDRIGINRDRKVVMVDVDKLREEDRRYSGR